MNKPYIICHMMTSVDGRIDCGMTAKLRGVNEYYDTLSVLNTPSTVSGRVTAELEMALPGKFVCKAYEAYGKDGYSCKVSAEGYDIVMDTKGTLLWNAAGNEKPLLIVMSQKVSKEYIAYLDKRNISWIVAGEERIDLAKACAVLHDAFGVERMSVVGGGHINAGFLEAGLLDEVSIVIGPGIDGRGGMAVVFDGLPMDREVTPLKLAGVEQYKDDAVWLRYTVE